MRIDENGNAYIKSKAQFTFELKGSSYIEASTLSKILNETIEIVDQIVQGEQDTFVNLKITKFSTGSFDIDFQAVAEQIENIITDPKAVAAGIVSAVGGVFGIVKHLKGKTPQKIIAKGENVEIVNTEGDTFTVNSGVSEKFFNNAKIEQSVINIVNVVKKDTDRPGFSINGDSTNVEYDREALDKVSGVVENMKAKKERIQKYIVDVTLIIRKPDLMGNSKWGFVFDRNIEATIEDKDWLEKIRNQKTKFGKGMKLPVTLQIETKLDENDNPITEPTYSVIKVTGDIIEEDSDNQTVMKL